jgi:hypothetical protein
MCRPTERLSFTVTEWHAEAGLDASPPVKDIEACLIREQRDDTAYIGEMVLY